MKVALVMYVNIIIQWLAIVKEIAILNGGGTMTHEELMRKVNCTTDVQEACCLGYSQGFDDGYDAGFLAGINRAIELCKRGLKKDDD